MKEISSSNAGMRGDEAEARRKNIAERYGITEEESLAYLKKIRDVLPNLIQNPSIQNIADTLEGCFDERNGREVVLKGALIDSVVGKLSESIRHYLPAEAQQNFGGFLGSASRQLGGQRTFITFQDLHSELKRYMPIISKYGLDIKNLAKSFLAELSDYLNRSDL